MCMCISMILSLGVKPPKRMVLQNYCKQNYLLQDGFVRPPTDEKLLLRSGAGQAYAAQWNFVYLSYYQIEFNLDCP